MQALATPITHGAHIETTQSIYASSSGNYSVTVGNGTPVSNSNSLSFDVNEYVDLTNYNHNFQEEISICAWVKMDGLGHGTLINRRNNNNIDFVFELNPTNNKPYVHFGSSGSVTANNAISSNEWHFISATKTAQYISIYIDGILDVQVSSLGSVQNNTGYLRIGKYTYNNSYHDYFTGDIDEIQIWDVRLANRKFKPTCLVHQVVMRLGYILIGILMKVVEVRLQITSNGGTINGASWSTDAKAQYCNNCTATDSVVVNVVPPPTVDLGDDTTTICQGDSVLLDAGAGHTNYLWSTGETSQTIYASASGSYSVTVGNGTAVSNSNSLSFDGQDDYVSIGRDISTDFSIALWTKTTQVGTTTHSHWFDGKGLVDMEVSGVTNDFGTSLLQSKFAFGTGSPDVTIVSSTDINDGNWHFCVATRKSSTGELKIYVDGVLENTGTGRTGALTASNIIKIGSDNNRGFFLGEIDEVSIWDKVLTADEILKYTYFST